MFLPKKIIIPHEKHLGDTIDLLVLIESFGFFKNEEFIVSGNKSVKELIDLFDFKKISFSEYSINFHSSDPIHHGIWNFIRINKIKIFLPNFKYSTGLKNDHMLVQFDSRSSYFQKIKDNKKSTKYPFSAKEIELSLKKWGEEPWFIIGGIETKKYIDVPLEKYKLGNLKYLCCLLDECKIFLGCCSGMAHLAGLLGVNSIVITLFEHEGFSTFYKTLYPTVNCNYREELNPHKVFI